MELCSVLFITDRFAVFVKLQRTSTNIYRNDIFTDMKIGRDCSSSLHSGSLALASIPLRSQTLPCLFSRCIVEMMTPPGLSRCSDASGCSHPLLTPCSASCSSLLIVLMPNAKWLVRARPPAEAFDNRCHAGRWATGLIYGPSQLSMRLGRMNRWRKYSGPCSSRWPGWCWLGLWTRWPLSRWWGLLRGWVGEKNFFKEMLRIQSKNKKTRIKEKCYTWRHNFSGMTNGLKDLFEWAQSSNRTDIMSDKNRNFCRYV